MNKKLTGRTALVTGGSRGIGAAIARSLAEDGADVAISYVASPDKAKTLVRELQEKGVRAVAFQADQAKLQTDLIAKGQRREHEEAAPNPLLVPPLGNSEALDVLAPG